MSFPIGGPSRVRRWLTGVLGSLAVAAPVCWLAANHVDSSGVAFFEAGREASRTLANLARLLEAGDLEAFSRHLGEEYSGSPLGLTRLELVDEKDGVRRLRLRPAPGETDRAAAAAEWREYLEGFASIEELALHVHRVESWGEGEETVVVARYELIGTPAGESRPGIDRALVRLRLRPTEAGPLLAAMEMVEGDRVIAEAARFREIGAEAGIDFENRFYPPFLEEPLAFGMLRYGPAGITAADVDADGYHDLFVPDGVASRYLRNRGDGTFEDLTAAAGLEGLDGVSVALFADFDNDGHKDLFASRTFRPNQLFRNRGDGTFEDVTAGSGLGEDCCTTVASWGDIDLDGDLDLYVGRYLDPRLAIPTTFYARNGEPNQLYRNEGDGRFTNVTEEAGVGEPGLCLGTVFGDVDDDGDPDLYVANDFGRKTLYRNRGDGTFEDVTVESGALAYGAGMSASLGDYDNDRDLDIYVAHIRSEHGWFAERPTVLRYMLNTWRQDVWRTDMPLYLEIFRQSGFGFVQVFQDMASGNTLLRNRGDGRFEDVSWQAGANPPGWFWGSDFADFDNDGWLDLYSANGWVYNEPDTEIELEFLNSVVSDMPLYKSGALFDPETFGTRSWHGWERNRHLSNRGDGTFLEIGRAAGTDLLLNSRGTAVADFWNRGLLDIAVAASTDRHALLRNEGEIGTWLQVELAGGAGELAQGTNRDAVGVRLTLEAGGLVQTREVALGDGYGSQNQLRQHFGLGGVRRIDSLTVRWPRSGLSQRFTDLPINRIVEVREGAPEAVAKSYGGPVP